MAVLRAARYDEDEILARLLYNAFRLNWYEHQTGRTRPSFEIDVRRCINWEHDLSAPLPELPSVPDEVDIITGASAARLASWRATISLTRSVGGFVDVAIAPNEDVPAAVSCFLPPGVRQGFFALLMSGCIFLPFKLGLRAAYRSRYNYRFAEALWHPVLESSGEQLQAGGNVLVLGTDPSHAGHGYAAQLLQWQIERHREESPGVPIYLETATDHAQKVYERLGFEEKARGGVHLRGVYEQGLKLPKLSGSRNDGKVVAEPCFVWRCLRLAPS